MVGIDDVYGCPGGGCCKEMTTNTPSYRNMNDTQLSSFSAGLIFGVDEQALHRYTQWRSYQYAVHLHFAVCHDIWVLILLKHHIIIITAA